MMNGQDSVSSYASNPPKKSLQVFPFNYLPSSICIVWFVFLDGMAAADPSSDWNAPVEHWGNYEEPSVLVTPAPVQKEQPVPNKVFFFFLFFF